MVDDPALLEPAEPLGTGRLFQVGLPAAHVTTDGPIVHHANVKPTFSLAGDGALECRLAGGDVGRLCRRRTRPRTSSATATTRCPSARPTGRQDRPARGTSVHGRHQGPAAARSSSRPTDGADRRRLPVVRVPLRARTRRSPARSTTASSRRASPAAPPPTRSSARTPCRSPPPIARATSASASDARDATTSTPRCRPRSRRAGAPARRRTRARRSSPTACTSRPARSSIRTAAPGSPTTTAASAA